jgi:hypothetical protein
MLAERRSVDPSLPNEQPESQSKTKSKGVACKRGVAREGQGPWSIFPVSSGAITAGNTEGGSREVPSGDSSLLLRPADRWAANRRQARSVARFFSPLLRTAPNTRARHISGSCRSGSALWRGVGGLHRLGRRGGESRQDRPRGRRTDTPATGWRPTSRDAARALHAPGNRRRRRHGRGATAQPALRQDPAATPIGDQDAARAGPIGPASARERERRGPTGHSALAPAWVEGHRVSRFGTSRRLGGRELVGHDSAAHAAREATAIGPGGFNRHLRRPLMGRRRRPRDEAEEGARADVLR